MLHFYKFCADIEGPAPARETYRKRPPGKGSPEECPPLRAASAFGWDVVTSFDMEFLKEADGNWRLKEAVEVESDWLFDVDGPGASKASPDVPGEQPSAPARSLPHGPPHGGAPGSSRGPARDAPPGAGPAEADAPAAGGVPLTQVNAWFWEKDQTLPHVISPEVYPEIQNQVKVSTFLFLSTDPNELLLITDIPNLQRPFRVLTALIDTDWYPASYPWHCVLELNAAEKRIVVPRGTPLCRLMTLRRDHYFAREMSLGEFEAFFQRGQEWLTRHAKGERSGMMDITRVYVRQQQKSRFSVIF
jgi:hypothetical protein